MEFSLSDVPIGLLNWIQLFVCTVQLRLVDGQDPRRNLKNIDKVKAFQLLERASGKKPSEDGALKAIPS